ncbi:hypothetical protein VCSRO12_0352 [Vibrio cholerae]|jgi:hypothetical protein|uniref:Uncharacterized protein n=1 Tax=Vibrio metoecus TaxID=1481663 RepID=A0A0Q0VEU1_VIBMT|nr:MULTISPECIES: hypothetical protein [Vibrio]APF81259.1 hypothetical protein ASZ85_03772 [Vibrio cholerae]EGR0834988.1 hypothetical protein [Vibrio cholerae]EGR1700722.1 hypothetical protein [Vibrio cholerae]EGR1964771.1 hypothetical protein [Vibrio cholerae]EGR2423693.1 hypothetical protein [Vibrio cholerae]
MTHKIAVVYIGPKPKKKDTVAGSRLVFPRHKPVLVEQDLAYQLLDFPSVWITEEELEDHLKLLDEKAQAIAHQRAAQEAMQEAEEKAASMVVMLNGEELDLDKLNSAKLKTLIAANELDIAPKGAQEEVTEFRVRVRDYLRRMSEESEPANLAE